MKPIESLSSISRVDFDGWCRSHPVSAASLLTMVPLCVVIVTYWRSRALLPRMLQHGLVAYVIVLVYLLLQCYLSVYYVRAVTRAKIAGDAQVSSHDEQPTMEDSVSPTPLATSASSPRKSDKTQATTAMLGVLVIADTTFLTVSRTTCTLRTHLFIQGLAILLACMLMTLSYQRRQDDYHLASQRSLMLVVLSGSTGTLLALTASKKLFPWSMLSLFVMMTSLYHMVLHFHAVEETSAHRLAAKATQVEDTPKASAPLKRTVAGHIGEIVSALRVKPGVALSLPLTTSRSEENPAAVVNPLAQLPLKNKRYIIKEVRAIVAKGWEVCHQYLEQAQRGDGIDAGARWFISRDLKGSLTEADIFYWLLLQYMWADPQLRQRYQQKITVKIEQGERKSNPPPVIDPLSICDKFYPLLDKAWLRRMFSSYELQRDLTPLRMVMMYADYLAILPYAPQSKQLIHNHMWCLSRSSVDAAGGLTPELAQAVDCLARVILHDASDATPALRHYLQFMGCFPDNEADEYQVYSCADMSPDTLAAIRQRFLPRVQAAHDALLQREDRIVHALCGLMILSLAIDMTSLRSILPTTRPVVHMVLIQIVLGLLCVLGYIQCRYQLRFFPSYDIYDYWQQNQDEREEDSEDQHENLLHQLKAPGAEGGGCGSS